MNSDEKKFQPTADKIGGNVKFEVSDPDIMLIGIAVTRFMDFLRSRGIVPTKNHAQNLHMDLGAVHSNGCPLEFSALLAMDLTPFVEDIFGIGKNLDRATGKLLNGFRPRCARSSVLRVH